MNRRNLPVFRILFRSLSTKKLNSKFAFEVDEDVGDKLRARTCNVRKHPGSFKIKPVSLPDSLTQAVKAVLQGYPWSTLSKDADELNKYIWSRHPPLESEELRVKKQEVTHRIKEMYHIDPDTIDTSEEERKRLQDSLQSRVHNRMKKEVYNWKAIQYDPYKCAVYLAKRLAPDFAALVRIMSEMRKRDPEYKPLTMLDFGSGVGSGMWALDHVWPEVCREVVCVDSSTDMNNLADKLLRGGDPEGKRIVREGGSFFKQFLPLSNLLKYDLVISSRSLFELPDMNTRLRTVDILWRKTSGYLVLVEAGTNAGYRLILEARDYVLELSRRAQEKGESNPEGYVFSPCPHDNFCPKFFSSQKIPCNFEVSFNPLPLERKKTFQKEKFTYVVLKRGKREESTEKHWPRLLESPLKRNRHIVCRVCTASGTLRELTATKRKHTSECYKLTRFSDWGDLFPVDISEEPDDSNNVDDDDSYDDENFDESEEYTQR